jgi:hypothetical protein
MPPDKLEGIDDSPDTSSKQEADSLLETRKSIVRCLLAGFIVATDADCTTPPPAPGPSIDDP